MKNTIYTKTASAAFLLAAAASLAACSLPLKQEVYRAETTAPAPSSDVMASDVSEEASEKPSEDNPATSDNSYERFINGFKNAVNSHEDAWYYGPDVDASKAPDDAVGVTTAGIWGDSFTYILYDMDKDGTDELFIGEEKTEQGDAYVNVYGVVTIADGKYKVIAAGWERSELVYLGSTNFYESGSSGADLHGASIYKYNSEKKSLDIVCNIEYETKGDGTTKIELFEGENGKIKSNVASCKDKEAEEKFDQAKKDASKEKNEILGKEWTKVSFK